MVRSFAVKPADPACFLSTAWPVFSPVRRRHVRILSGFCPKDRPMHSTPQRKKPVTYLSRFPARFGTPKTPGFRADKPSTRCLDRLGGVSVRNPFGIDRRGLQTHSRRTGEG